MNSFFPYKLTKHQEKDGLPYLEQSFSSFCFPSFHSYITPTWYPQIFNFFFWVQVKSTETSSVLHAHNATKLNEVLTSLTPNITGLNTR